MSKGTTSRRFQLAHYLAVLAIDWRRREAFLRNPKKEMLNAGLNDGEIARLDRDQIHELLRYLRAYGPKPAIDEQIGEG